MGCAWPFHCQTPSAAKVTDNQSIPANSQALGTEDSAVCNLPLIHFTKSLDMIQSRFLLGLSLVLCFVGLQAQPDPSQQNSSPYFYIQTEGIHADQFPLLGTKVHARISGPVADVVVEQRYKNDGSVPIEALYVFPASSRSAVYYMSMRIGDRVITADIEEKKKAKEIYQQAQQEGKRATLLEQHRPNVFQISVTNILPGDEIIVTLRYNEFLIPEERIYSFVYPTVVGPRFVGEDDPAEAGYAANPHIRPGDPVPYLLDIWVELSAGLPIQESFSPSHEIELDYLSETKASIRLRREEQRQGNRDFIFRYRMAGRSVQSGTMFYEHGDENFFLTTIEPPERLPSHQILPREYVFVIDISGSMHGFPLNISKHLMRNLINQLRPIDHFNILLFAGGSEVLSEASLPATAANLTQALRFVEQNQGGGSTQLLQALRHSLALPRPHEHLSRSLVVITDGYVSIEQEAFDLIANRLGESNLFAFGIGGAVNRHLIEGMAHVGRGEAFIVTEDKYAKGTADRFQKYIQHPVMTDIEVDFDGLEVYEVVPRQVPDLLASRPIYIFGKYRGMPKGEVTVTGMTAQGPYRRSLNLQPPMQPKEHVALRYLWAREKIRWHEDFVQLAHTPERIEEITQLGLRYHLLTNYTSFIAVDHQEVAHAQGPPTKVKQVLPMPQGVSSYAIGFEMGVDKVVKASEAIAPKTLYVNVSPADLTDAVWLETAMSVVLKGLPAFADLGQDLIDLEVRWDERSSCWRLTSKDLSLAPEIVETILQVVRDHRVDPAKNTLLTIQLVWA